MLRQELFRIGRTVARAAPRMVAGEIRQFDDGIVAQRIKADLYRIWLLNQMVMFSLIHGRFIKTEGWTEPPIEVKKEKPKKTRTKFI